MMNNNPIDKWQVILSTSLISGTGALMFGVFPIFIGSIAKHLNLSEEQAGYLPSAFFIGYMLLSISTVFWVRKINWRIAALGGVIITSLPLLAMQGIESYNLVLTLMFICGAGMGILYSLATAILSDSSNPDRVFGIKLAVETMPGTAFLFLLPLLIIPAWGFNGIALALALYSLASALCIFWMPKQSHRKEVIAATTMQSISESAVSGTLLTWLGLLATLLYFTAVSTPWVFLQLMGEAINLEGEHIGAVLSAGLFMAILGGFIAAAIGTRFGHILPMLVIMSILFLALLILGHSQTLISFAISSLMLLFTMNLALSFLLGITARVDKQGRLIVLSTTALAIAVIIGPAIGGNLVGNGDFSNLLWFSAACGVLSLGLYIYVALCAPTDNNSHRASENSEIAEAV